MITWRKFKMHKADAVLKRVGFLEDKTRERARDGHITRIENSKDFLLYVGFNKSPYLYIRQGYLIKETTILESTLAEVAVVYRLHAYGLSGSIRATHYSILNKPKELSNEQRLRISKTFNNTHNSSR